MKTLMLAFFLVSGEKKSTRSPAPKEDGVGKWSVQIPKRQEGLLPEFLTGDPLALH